MPSIEQVHLLKKKPQPPPPRESRPSTAATTKLVPLSESPTKTSKLPVKSSTDAAAAKADPKNKKNGLFSSIGRLLGFASDKSLYTGKSDSGVPMINGVEVTGRTPLWGSAQGLYTLMMLSRVSRLSLILRGRALDALNGEKAACTLQLSPKDYRTKLMLLKQELNRECGDLVVPPTSLKELVHRKKYELKSIFSNYPQIHRLIGNVEQLLFTDIIKFHYFIPMILAVNTLTRCCLRSYSFTRPFTHSSLTGI